MSPQPCTERLLQLVQTKLHLLEQLHTFSLQQADWIATQETEELLRCLSRKNEILDSLQTVQAEMQSYASQPAEQRIWASPEQRKACQQMLAKIEQRLTSLLQLDQHAVETMQESRDLIASQLTQVASAGVLAQAYQGSSSEAFASSAQLNLEG